jgi:predicted lipid-binding transport protein (Tim44 family)
VFAEIKLQLDERGRGAQQTDVVQLDAELLGLETEEARHVASVRFHGLIREEADGQPAPFNEIWHLTKPKDGSSGWVIAGIQQVQ